MENEIELADFFSILWQKKIIIIITTIIFMIIGFSGSVIIENIENCEISLNGQDIKLILKNFPLRKRIFLRCALMKIIFPLKLYINSIGNLV